MDQLTGGILQQPSALRNKMRRPTADLRGEIDILAPGPADES